MNMIPEDQRIRSDFKKALCEVEHGYDLSNALGYGFSDRDITELAKLHKDNPDLREKIEELLEDCNFHTECGDFSEGEYEKYL